jgi:hypothetical protein
MRVNLITNSSDHISSVFKQLETIARLHDTTIKDLVLEASSGSIEPYLVRTMVLVKRLQQMGVKFED